MTRLNPDFVRDRAVDVRRNVEQARRYASLDPEEYSRDERNQYAVEHLLLIAIEAAAALCTHILAATRKGSPAGYADCFTKLADAGVVSPELAERLGRMAGFRNLLVHRYWDVDSDRVVEFARRDSKDLEAFLTAIASWLDAEI